MVALQVCVALREVAKFIRTNERLCSPLGLSYLGAVVYRIMQRRERWFHWLPSHEDHGTASFSRHSGLRIGARARGQAGASSRHSCSLEIGH